ncbi:MAG TPA: DUF3750 domain-containing protein [Marinobacterium sp.]|nr:DUF3750 domain-containing protein [Marinobacterium sp.]
MYKFLKLVAVLSMIATLQGCTQGNWQTARRDSAGIAPPAEATPEAVLQVYGADVFGWRGLFAIHTWIAAKPTGANSYTVYEVIGWRANRGLPALVIRKDLPDRYWFGAEPELLVEHRGEGVDDLIAAVDTAARNYPWANEYRLFPGPNSNTFPSWVAEQVPALDLDLPLSAIGQSWRP